MSEWVREGEREEVWCEWVGECVCACVRHKMKSGRKMKGIGKWKKHSEQLLC